MPSELERELAPGTVAAIRAMVPTPTFEPISDEQLARFALGHVTAEERTAMVTSLARNPAARRRMVSLRTDPPRGLVATVLNQYRRLATSARVVPQDLAFRATLRAIGNSLRTSMTTPQFALTRSGLAETPFVGEARVSETGDLRIELRNLPIEREGHSLSVLVSDPCGGALRIGSGVVRAGSMVLELPEVGTALGFSAGEISLAFLCFRWKSDEAEPTPRLLWVELPDGNVEAVEIREGPRISEGALKLVLANTAIFETGTLELRLAVGTSTVAIGQCKIRSEPSATVEAVVPVADIEDMDVYCGSLLRARLLPY